MTRLRLCKTVDWIPSTYTRHENNLNCKEKLYMKTLVFTPECKFCFVTRPSRLRKSSLVSQPYWTRVIWYLWISRMNRASWLTFPRCTVTLATSTLQVKRNTNLGDVEAFLAYWIDIAQPFFFFLSSDVVFWKKQLWHQVVSTNLMCCSL